MISALLSALALAQAAPGVEVPRLWSSTVNAGFGVLGSATDLSTGRFGDVTLAPVVGLRGVLPVGFLGEVDLYVSAPVRRAGPYASVGGTVRAGWAWERWAFSVGVALSYAPAGAPAFAVPLPSLRVHGQLHPVVGASLGVLDVMGLVPAHLSAELGPFGPVRFSVGYVAPLGAIATADVKLPGGFGLQARGFYSRIDRAELAMVTVGARFGGDGR